MGFSIYENQSLRLKCTNTTQNYVCCSTIMTLTFQGRDVNDCLTSPDETCENMVGESCTLQGDAIHTTPSGSTLDANSCNELCILYERYNCTHWQFDKVEMQCSLYDSKDVDCSSISGPELPSIESCKSKIYGTSLWL